MGVKNAKIEGTSLGVAHTDHGILSFYIRLNFGGTAQGFGGWMLDNPNLKYDYNNRELPPRLPTTLASSLLLGIDRVFGVDWENLKGLPCRAYEDADRGILTALGHYLEDKWLWLNGEEFTVTKLAKLPEVGAP